MRTATSYEHLAVRLQDTTLARAITYRHMPQLPLVAGPSQMLVGASNAHAATAAVSEDAKRQIQS